MALPNSVPTVLFYTTIAICFAVITPTLLYYCWRFNTYRNTIVVRNRFPQIVNGILFLLLLNICIRMPLSLWPEYKHTSSIFVVEAFLSLFLTHAVVTIIALRIWMIFYKLNYTYASSTSAWKTVINPLLATNNWFLNPRNKARYGNGRVMLFRYFLPLYVVYGVVHVLLLINLKWSVWFHLSLSWYQLIDGLSYCLVFAFCVYLYHKTPQWEDHCAIHAELKLGSIVYIACLVCYILASVIFSILNHTRYRDYHQHIQHLIATYVTLLFFCVYGLLLTWYPTHTIRVKASVLSRVSSPDQIELVLKQQQQQQQQPPQSNLMTSPRALQLRRAATEPALMSSTAQTSRPRDHEKVHSKDDLAVVAFDNDLSTILTDVLSDGDLFDVFMAYLSRSFSMETLLSYVEFFQFKQYIILQFKQEILTDGNRTFIERLELKMNGKYHHRHRVRYKPPADSHNASVEMHADNEPATHGILLPETIPKSFVVFGEFMVASLINGKSLRQSVSRLEDDTHKYGAKLYQQQQLQQHTIQDEQHVLPSLPPQKVAQQSSSSHSADSQRNSRSKSPLAQKKLTPNSISVARTTARNNAMKQPAIAAATSVTAVTSFTQNAESFNNSMNAKLQIPAAESVDYMMHTESVTEKDIYDEHGKGGTPSIASQTIPNEITSIETSEREENEHDAIHEEEEESETNTAFYKLPGRGAEVSVDEQLMDKNRDFSVTPVPSYASQNQASSAMFTYPRNISNTARTAHARSSKSKRRAAPSLSVGGLGSGAGGRQFSVTVDYGEEKETFSKKTSSTTANDSEETKEKSPPSPPSNHHEPSTEDANHVQLKGIGFGVIPVDIEAAKMKTRIIAHKLYMKYVHSGSELEINISHRVKKKLLDHRLSVLEEFVAMNVNIQQLYSLYDECMEEMYTLMRSLITVFITTDDYHKMIQHHHNR